MSAKCDTMWFNESAAVVVAMLETTGNSIRMEAK